MSYVNLNNPANFQLQEFEQLGFRYIVSGRPTIGGETYRTIFVLTDAVVTATCPNGDSLSSETLVAGTVIHGFFEDVSVASGSLLAYKAGPITAQEIFDAYKAYVYAQGGIVEGESCAVADIAALLEDKLYSAASLVLIPSGYKVSHLYAERPLDSNGDFTFTRASSATRVNSSGLIEKVRTNLLLESNSFDNWSRTAGSSVTSGQSGYDGSSDAWLLNDSGNSSAYCIYRGYTNMGVQTFSIYAKQASTSQIEFDFLGGGGGYLRVELTDGSLDLEVNTIDYNIEDVGDGWWRCSFSANQDSAPLLVRIGCNGAGSIYIQDAQVNYGLVAQEYQETTTTSVVSGITNDMPRLDYSGGASCPSLLLEPSRQNLIADSEFLAGSYWSKTAVTVTSNDGTSPTGYNDAQSIIPNTSNDSHILSRNIVLTSGNSYTASFFVKSDGYTSCAIRLGVGSLWAGGQGPTVLFDLDALTGSVIDGSGVTYKIEDYGNGWRRCSVTGSCVSSGTTSFLLYVKEYGPFVGDGTSGLLAFGGSLEAGSYPTSYIPTYGTSATRLADSASKTGISSLIGQTEGTLYWEGSIDNFANFGTCLAVEGLAGSWIYILSVNAGFAFEIRNNYVTSMNYVSTSAAGNYKIAIGYNASQVVIYINGTLVHTDNIVTIPATSNLYLGGWSGYTQATKTAQALVFKTRLSNAQLAELTTL